MDTIALLGSDVVDEYPVPGIDRENIGDVNNLRFVLAAKQEFDATNEELLLNSKIRIGTSYPRTASAVLERVGICPILDERAIVEGGVESLPWQPILGVDAIFELVQSGESLCQNNLRIVRDDLHRVELLKVTKC